MFYINKNYILIHNNNGDNMIKNKIKIDKLLIFYLLFFFITSLISIYSASKYLSPSLGNLVLKQIIWYTIGFIIIIIIIKTDINKLLKYAPIIYILNNILLLGLLFFAPSINGSKCWYLIKGIGSFQPTEFMKISLLLMEVYIINKYNKNKLNIKDEFILLIKISIVFLIPSILTILEPDTGAILVFFIETLTILFLSNIRIRWFIILGIIIISFLSIFFYLYFYKQNMFIKTFGSDFFYRIDRIINWKNKSGMQLENSLSAIGSSYLFGHGMNNTPIYFPEAGTDFIFTVFVSNFGFIGFTIFIMITLFFDNHIINITKKEKDKSYKFLLIGISSVFIYQQIQNIAMTIGLLPITGITLPFISYGGSSLLSYMILIGFVFSIYNKKEVTS